MRTCLISLVLGLCACSTPPSGVTGMWSAHAVGPGGGIQDLTLSLESRGDRVTGTVQAGSLDTPHVIENGRIEQDDVSFVIRVGHGPDAQPATFTFTAKLAGDQLQGSAAGPGRQIQFTATRTSSTPQPLAGGAHGEGRQTTRASQPPNPQGSNPTPQNAGQATLAAFDRYEVVGLGILSYANQDFDQFILDLIRNPAFPAKVNDIVVECGNSLYQPILDRYMAGDSIPLARVQQVWRNTTQPFCGVSGFYEELFPLVRRINQQLPADRKLRVLAGDPPVDWSKVRTAADLNPSVDRDGNIAGVMEREVLAKHRKALMIFGVLHLMHGSGGAVGRYERAGYPNRTFVIMAHNGFGTGSPLGRYNDELERRMAGWPVPSLVSLQGTWLDDLPWTYFFPDEERGVRLSAAVDAYLYLGPGDLLLNQPIPAAATLDTAYMAELLRRARIRQGPDASNVVLREAANPSAFFNQPAPGTKN